MAVNETTSQRVARIASTGLFNPESLTPGEIRTLCAAALTQTPDHIPANALAMGTPFEVHLRNALIDGLVGA